MGIIQCATEKAGMNNIWENIERNLENSSTYFERALLDEYKEIKFMFDLTDKV